MKANVPVTVASRRPTSVNTRRIDKRKFGGREVTLTPTLDLIYDATAYADFTAAERVDTGDIAEYEHSVEGS